MMCTRLMIGVLLAGSTLTAALAQSTTTGAGATNQPASLSDRTVRQNAQANAVSERSPSTWIRAAQARHNQLIDERVRARARGDQPETPDNSNNTNSTATATTSNGLAGLLGSLSSLGSLISSGGLTTNPSAAGGGTGSQTPTTTPPAAGGTVPAGSDTTIDGPAGGSEFDPNSGESLEDFIRRRAEEERAAQGQTAGGAATNPSTGTTASIRFKPGRLQTANSGTGNGGSASNPLNLGGGFARLQKRDYGQREQSITDLLSLAGGGTNQDQNAELPFRTRWSNAMLTAFFTALNVGISSPAFVGILADALRPILRPETAADAGDSGDGSSGDGSGDGSGGSGDGGTGTDGGGTGVEDVDPPSGGGGGSTI